MAFPEADFTIPGSVEAMRALAASFHQTSATLESQAAALDQAAATSRWTGIEGEVWKSQTRLLASHARTYAQIGRMVARTHDAFAGTIETLQRQMRPVHDAAKIDYERVEADKRAIEKAKNDPLGAAKGGFDLPGHEAAYLTESTKALGLRTEAKAAASLAALAIRGFEFETRALNFVFPHYDAFMAGKVRYDGIAAMPHGTQYPAQNRAFDLLKTGAFAGMFWNLTSGKDQKFFSGGIPFVDPAVPPAKGEPDYSSEGGFYQATIQQTYDERGVMVTTIHQPGQPVRFIVAVPGTQAGGRPFEPSGYTITDDPASQTGRNWAANAYLMAGSTSPGMQAQIDAIDQIIQSETDKDRQQNPDAYANNPGQPQILLTGHSQGGILAAAMANDPTVRSRYNVKGVVTYAAPIDTVAPGDVPVLAYETGTLPGGDPVPHLDLDPGHKPNVTTITLPPTGTGFSNHEQSSYTNQLPKPDGTGDNRSDEDKAAAAAKLQQMGFGDFVGSPDGRTTSTQVTQAGSR